MSSVVPRPAHAELRDEIQASQRGRMLVAMSDVVGEKGYAAATVADVLRASGVSRRTFYEHFADKEACLLAAYEHGVDVITQALSEEVAGAETWRERTEVAIAVFLRMLASEPGFARAFLVEIWSAGATALERHGAALERFHALVRALHEQAREEDPAVAPATDAQIAAVTGGISRVATLELLAGRAASLPDLSGELVDFAVAVLARR